jgi:hypothetical protein
VSVDSNITINPYFINVLLTSNFHISDHCASTVKEDQVSETEPLIQISKEDSGISEYGSVVTPTDLNSVAETSDKGNEVTSLGTSSALTSSLMSPALTSPEDGLKYVHFGS